MKIEENTFVISIVLKQIANIRFALFSVASHSFANKSHTKTMGPLSSLFEMSSLPLEISLERITQSN